MKQSVRINLRNNELNIYEILTVYHYQKNNYRIVLCINDKTTGTQICNDNIIQTLNRLGLKIDNIVKYSEYYNIAWIYTHRLLITKKLKTYDLNGSIIDLPCIIKNNTNITFKIHDGNSEYIIYECGLFREIFINILIDDIQKIDNHVNISTPDITSDNISTNIYNLYSAIFNNILKLNSSLIDNLKFIDINNDYGSLQKLMNCGFDIEDIYKMSTNVDFQNTYIYCCNSNPKKCIINPIKIKINEPRKVTLDDKTIEIKNNIYIDNKVNINLGCNKKSIKMKGVGIINIDIVNKTGSWEKMKKKRNSDLLYWIPEADVSEFVCDDGVTVAINKQEIANAKVFKIQSEYYVIDCNNAHILRKIN